MKWPPVKAWTCKNKIKGHYYFVAINYGGISNERWINMVSVTDSNVSLKVYWPEISDTSKWASGWSDFRQSKEQYFDTIDREFEYETLESLDLSSDSGLTIPIVEESIREWF